MKKKILLVGMLTIVIALFFSILNVQGQVNVNVSVAQTQTQQMQQGSINVEPAQNQLQNQGEESQVQPQQQEMERVQNQAGSAASMQRRSRVANAVQAMLKIAEKNSDIGQQIRVIAQTQNQNQEKLEAGLEKIQDRSGVVKFFIGPKYGEINNAKQILEQNCQQIEQLKQIKNQLINQADQQNLVQQIQVIEQAGLEIENSLNESQKGFSLLGWLFRLFANK